MLLNSLAHRVLRHRSLARLGAGHRGIVSASGGHQQPLEGIPPPLKGIKVVDLTRVLAGPTATMLLADLGADVIKIEEPKRGDDTRSWAPPTAPKLPPSSDPAPHQPAETAYFLSANRNKRSLTLNIRHEKGREVIRKMVEQADVLVENFVPGKLTSYGLGYHDLSAINPRLVYASISGYGQTGPYSSAPGYDVIIEAEAGLMHITGERDGRPVKVGVAITDLTTGLYAHGAIMAALLGRQATGKGAWIDASLMESQIASLANIASNYLIADQEAGRHGTEHPSIVPYQVFPTLDGWIMIGAGNDRQFQTLSGLLSKPEWATDERFSSNSARVANRKTLIQAIEDVLKGADTAHWLEQLRGNGIPFGPINNIRQTFEHPQAVAREVMTTIQHPRAGPIKLASPAVTYSGKKMPVTRPPPYLGQHTNEVLAELGYDASAIEAMRAEGVV